MGIYAAVLPVFLRRHALSTTAIGLLSSLSIAWALKVLWSPLVDRYGERRRWMSWPDWAVTTQVDTVDHWKSVKRAVLSHRSQVGACALLGALDETGHRRLWGTQRFYRAMSLVDPGFGVEHDLFAGIRLDRAGRAEPA